MAIRDKEKENRPRGLRMPSLSAIKFKKTNHQSPPDSPPTELPPEISLFPAYPARTDSVPVRPPRPHEKELPPNPLPLLPPFPAASASSSSGYRDQGPPLPPLPPQDRDLSPRNLSPAASPPSSMPGFAANSHANFSPTSPPNHTGFSPSNRFDSSPSSPPSHAGFSPNSPPNRTDSAPVKRVPSIPRVPVPKSEKPPLPVQRPTPPSSINHDIDEPPRRQPSAAEQQHQHQQQEEEEEEEEDPLEDFIPDPEVDRVHPHPEHEHENEPDLDGPGSAIEEASSEENNGPWTPPDFEPVAAPLNKLHYVCYQDHRAMPPAANRWHALPCMTCQKFDREVRHRCVFCCLRICVGCYQTLQKSPNRSLEVLMDSLGES
ncbi:uncharacterized protein BDW47DRAFT_107547 [Aspergillus candidus]|uniref:Uncharacterized protein n=1 Tax=Aspergillus candidus TaxID=41067 RepID=A0A2I2F9B0_ASPCN|nr:hypothetical protein BDW47DRAFT_107547 [Aspergillus candidus]PLB37188.1 hypothetical protein BDW47DRAFT_107547 [Aspergillus candidus]